MPLRTLIPTQCPAPTCQTRLAIPLRAVVKNAANGKTIVCDVRCSVCEHVFTPRVEHLTNEQPFQSSSDEGTSGLSTPINVPDASIDVSAALLAAVRGTNALSATPGSAIQSIESAATSAESNRSFRRLGKLVMDINAGTSKVLKENKIGKEPSGFHFDMAHTFQLGLRKLANASRATGAVENESTTHRRLQMKNGASDSIIVTWDDHTGGSTLSSSLEAHGASAFKKIRESFNMPEPAFFASLAYMPEQTKPSVRVIGQGDTAGRSAAFFFLSPDQRFIIKSCTKEDTRQVLRILSKYARHVSDHKHTWLNRYFGLFTISRGTGGDKATLLVMNNFFAGQVAIHTRYDLKGSTYHRAASEKERKKSAPTYKDLDWIADKRQLCFRGKLDDAMKVVRADVDFLAKCNLIDYSLLVGIHNRVGTAVEPPPVRSFINRHINPDTVVYFGIVDILTPYVFRKKLEKMYHHTLRWRNASCTDPKAYADRFYEFVLKHSTNA